jgi:hypothetical protein
LGTTNLIKHDIDLKDEAPIYTKQYPLPFAHRQEVKELVKKLLDAGIIERSVSSWNSPVLLVKKKSEDNSVKFHNTGFRRGEG